MYDLGERTARLVRRLSQFAQMYQAQFGYIAAGKPVGSGGNEHWRQLLRGQ